MKLLMIIAGLVVVCEVGMCGNLFVLTAKVLSLMWVHEQTITVNDKTKCLQSHSSCVKAVFTDDCPTAST